MNRSERSLTSILFCLLLNACAPVTEQVQSLTTGISKSISGEQSVSFRSTAWDVVLILSKEAFNIQPSSLHTSMRAEDIGDHSLTLAADLAGGSSVRVSSINAKDAKAIQIHINCSDKEGFVEVTLKPDPANDDIARETVAKIIAKLDQKLSRYQATK